MIKRNNIVIWASTLTQGKYIKDNTILRREPVVIKSLVESDASNPKTFHRLPDHLKKILYLDSPDVILEIRNEPVFSVEITTEAGTGHNAFQRFARLAASIENNVPAFYIYPKGKYIRRKKGEPRWDKINPLIFRAMLRAMDIYQIPALLYFFPTLLDSHKAGTKKPEHNSDGLEFSRYHPKCPDERAKSMKAMFKCMNSMILRSLSTNPIDARSKMILDRQVCLQRDQMNSEAYKTNVNAHGSPISATKNIQTSLFIKSLKRFGVTNDLLGSLIPSRKKTILYQVDAKFRSDPYPGALAAIDYLKCRNGRTYEERDCNLVLVWGEARLKPRGSGITYIGKKATARDFVRAVQKSESKNLLKSNFHELKKAEIPRYYMQVRYGSTFSKSKHIRCFSYFADAIIFQDGLFWRSA